VASPTTDDARIRLLIVATWYPSWDDPVAGRFVADQAAALQASGRVAPTVVSFAPAGLIGGGRLRVRMAQTVGDLATAALSEADDVFNMSGAPAAGLPVARPGIAGGRDSATGVLYAARGRERALVALADRWAGGDRPDGIAPRPLPIDLPDLIHAHTVYPDGAAAATMAERLGRPLFLTEHASFVQRLLLAPEIRARYVAAVARAQRLIVVSQVLADEVVADLPEVAAKVVVIPNAVDVDAFRVGEAAGRLPGELLFVGYRKESKGLDTLLRAFALVRRARPTTTLRLIGGSPTAAIETGWRRLAMELGVGEAVHFEPPGDRPAVAAAMARAALFVHPSPRETFGVVAVEALAAGLPVVATDSGGVTEIMGPHPDRLGAIVPVGDPEALAAAIEATLDRRHTLDPLALRAAVTARFGSAGVAGRLLDVYEAATPALLPRARQRAPGITRVTGGPPLIVVALDPDRAHALAALGPAARARLILVTSAGPANGAPDGLAGLVTADLGGRVRAIADAASLGPPGGGLRRLRRIVRHPLAIARRRGLLPGLERSLTTSGAGAVREGVAIARRLARPQASSEGDADVVPELVCLDGVDYLAARSAVQAGLVRLAPGGLGWLGDRVGSG